MEFSKIKEYKWSVVRLILISGIFLSMQLLHPMEALAEETNSKEEVTEAIEKIFQTRNEAIINGDVEFIKSFYDTKTKYGNWAYEYEVRKVKYVHNWAEKQGVKFIEIKPKVTIRKIKGGDDTYSANLICSTQYTYMYENEPDTLNSCRIGTYHNIKLVNKDGAWIIVKEWYKDPFGDSLNLDNIKADDIRQYILAQPARDFSSLNQRRLNAVDYANRFCGAASEEEYGFKYNRKYKDYNPQGGDCANFASQILFEGGKFRKNIAWNYDGKSATGPWVNADKFKNYMVGSGRASVIAHGSYEKVYKASYKLLPGDFVAYESKGDINHISVVTGADTKGYSLVTCHNSDRNNVPWDLGWSNKKVKFWLVRVHY
jgi:hypothetical protein